MILSFGTVSLDWVQTRAGSRTDMIGGSALYFAAAASRVIGVRVVGPIGFDYPVARLQTLAAQGVDLGGLRLRRRHSLHWSARYDSTGDNRQTLSSNRKILEDLELTLTEQERAVDAVFVGSTNPRLQQHVVDQLPPRGERDRPLVVLDSMIHWIQELPSVIRSVMAECDVFLANDEEIRALSNKSDTGEAARAALEIGPSVVVVKHGRFGATAYTRESQISCPALLVESVDPTGAGDAFAGGFTGSWLTHTGPQRTQLALTAGAVCGAHATQRFSYDGLLEDASPSPQEAQRTLMEGLEEM